MHSSPSFLHFSTVFCLLLSLLSLGSSFAPACRKYQQAVGVVTYELVDKDGKPFYYEDDSLKIQTYTTIATAFAISPKLFVTSGHVMADIQHGETNTPDEIAEAMVDAYIDKEVEKLKEKAIAAAVEEAKKKAAEAPGKKPEDPKDKADEEEDDDDEEEIEIDEDELRETYCKEHAKELKALKAKHLETYKDVHVGAVRIFLSHSFGKKLTVTGVQFHAAYKDDTTEEEEIMTNGERDLAILTIQEETETWFPLADKPTLYDLCQGEEIGVLGFPMEGLASDGGLNMKAPEATFKRGSIGKITTATFDFSKDASKNKSIFHDVPISGGSSGSPLFLLDGRVIGVIWGGNAIGDEDILLFERISNPAQQNMAVRIDALEEIRNQPVEPIKIEKKH